jgi:hypothetical protein
MSLVLLFALVSVEGIYTTRWLNAPQRRQVDHLPDRLSEFVTLVIVVRLFTWTLGGSWPRISLLRNYLLYPISLFNDSFFMIGLLLVTLAWLKALSTESIFAQLAIDKAEAGYYGLAPADREPGKRPVAIDRGRLVDQLFQQWMWGAVILIVCSAITTFDLSGLDARPQFRSLTRSPLGSDSIVALMVYVLSGLLLLSQARMAAMRARWLISGTTVARRVNRSWHRSSLGLVIVIAFVAAFLPLGSTLGAGRILQAVLQGVYAAFSVLVALFLALLSMLVPQMSAPTTQRAAPAGPLAPPGSPAAEPNELFGILLSSMFWAIAIFVTVAAITFFLRDRGYTLRSSVLRNAWRAFLSWVSGLWRDLATQATLIRRSLPTRRRAHAASRYAAPKASWRLFRFSRMTAREQIRFLFLSIARRAGDRGMVRRLSDTPLEYATKLEETWPDTAADVEELTAAFLKARYSIEAIQREDVKAVTPAWRRLKSRLRRRRDRDGESSE